MIAATAVVEAALSLGWHNTVHLVQASLSRHRSGTINSFDDSFHRLCSLSASSGRHGRSAVCFAATAPSCRRLVIFLRFAGFAAEDKVFFLLFSNTMTPREHALPPSLPPPPSLPSAQTPFIERRYLIRWEQECPRASIWMRPEVAGVRHKGSQVTACFTHCSTRLPGSC